MHISEGVLSPGILTFGAALTSVGTWLGLRRLDYNHLTTVAMLSATFFVASLIHVPIGPSSAHLILNGLVGTILGWAAFPAFLVALLLQSILFQFGGITALGVNTFNVAFPAVLAFYLGRPFLCQSPLIRAIAAFCTGFFSIMGTALLTAFSLALTNEGFFEAAKILFLAHLPIMFIEGAVTMIVITYLAKVRPQVLAFYSS